MVGGGVRCAQPALRLHVIPGSTQRASAVRWGVAGNIVWAWIFTIPASAFVAAIAYWVSLQIF